MARKKPPGRGKDAGRPPKNPDRVRINLDLPRELRELLETVARQAGRTLTAEIARALRRYLPLELKRIQEEEQQA